MKEAELVESLRQIKKIFDRHHINFWLDFGTLLGAIRDKKIIAWDRDIDLGMWREDLQKLLSFEDEFRKEGIEIHVNTTEISLRRDNKYIGGAFTYHRSENKAINSHICYPTLYIRKKNDIVTSEIGRLLTILVVYGYWLFSEEDLNCPSLSQFQIKKLFFFMKKPMRELIYHISTKLFGFKYRTDIIPKEDFENLKSVKFYDMTVKIPDNVEDYLTYRYKDWKTPDRNYVIDRFKKTKKEKKMSHSKIHRKYAAIGTVNIHPRLNLQE